MGRAARPSDVDRLARQRWLDDAVDEALGGMAVGNVEPGRREPSHPVEIELTARADSAARSSVVSKTGPGTPAR